LSPQFAAAAIFGVFLLIVSITVHELGHALAARAVGLKVRRIVIGFGGIGEFKIVLKTRIAGVPLEISPVPIYGFVEVEPDDLSAPWAAAAVTTLAGPVANIAAGAAGLAIIAGHDLAITVVRLLTEAYWRTMPEVIAQGFDALRSSWQAPAWMNQDLAQSPAMLQHFPHWSEAALLLSFSSIILGLANLLPIPPLDGGRLVILALRWVPGFRKEVAQAAITAAGLALLLVIHVPFIRADLQRAPRSTMAGAAVGAALVAAMLLTRIVRTALAAARKTRARRSQEGDVP
jgi:regulator of sigma E protease